MFRAQRKAGLALLAAGVLALGACSSGDDGGDQSIVVATTNFSETKILAEMYAQVLEANGVEASVTELTTREVIIPALQNGEVQATPEYLGSLTDFLNREANGADAEQVASGDVDATYAEAQVLAEGENLTLLEPSAAQDQNAFAVQSSFAEENSLTTLTELGEYSQDSPVTLGGPPECPQRAFCQQGLEETYGVNVGSFLPLDAGGPLTIQALQQGRVDVGLVFSSSGAVSSDRLTVLEDDQDLQTAENILPALYTPAVTDTVTEALNSVSEVLTTEDLQRLNSEVENDRRNPDDVAQDYLTEKGLL